MATSGEDDVYSLIGLALVAAQRIEFLLYGIASLAGHTPAAQKEKRFRELTPEKFLRGGESERKATLGQIVETFGDAFLIRTEDLVTFYKDRNLIAHDFVRTFRMNIRGTNPRRDAREFLFSFLERALYWEDVLRGFLAELKIAAAKKEGREAELEITADDFARMETYRKLAERHLSARTTTQKS